MAFIKSTFLLLGLCSLALSLPSSRLQKDRSHEISCDRCLPGWGLVTLCNGSQPSVCKPCPPGTWSPHHPHLRGCTACSKCGKGLYVDKSCTSASDTKCGWCSSDKGHFNIDFIRKCLMRHDVPKNEESAALRLFFEEEKRNAMAPSDTGIVHHRLWRAEKDKNEPRPHIILKPTYHDYNVVDKVVLAHRRKVYILVGLTAVILFSTVIFAACFLYQYCCYESRGHKIDNQKLYVQLTDEQNSMIRESAARLDKLRHGSVTSQLSDECVELSEEDEFWEDDPLRITENPLEKLLPSLDGASETLRGPQVHENRATDRSERSNS